MFTTLGMLVLVLGTATTEGVQPRVTVMFAEGRVTMALTAATAAEALEEWGKVGQSRIEGADRLPLERLTFVLDAMDEFEALRTLVGPSAGLAVLPRAEGTAGGSRFARIIIMRTAGPVVEQNASGGATPERTFLYYAREVPVLSSSGDSVQQPEYRSPDVATGTPETVFRYFEKPLPEDFRRFKNEPAKVTQRGEPERIYQYHVPARGAGLATAAEKK